MTSRDKILEAARKEFADKGFEGARVDRIAVSAEVNKAMIYYHFGSKEQLYEAVIDGLVGRVRAFLEELLSVPSGHETVIRQLAAFWVRVLEYSPEIRPIVLREMAGGGERIRNLFSKMISEVGATDRFRDLIEQGIRDGSLRPVDPTHTFVSFIGMTLFYLLFSPLLNPIWEIEDEQAFLQSRPDAVVDLFLNGLRSR